MNMKATMMAVTAKLTEYLSIIVTPQVEWILLLAHLVELIQTKGRWFD